MSAEDDPGQRIERLERRLEREHAARLEAEQIAERTTAALYDRQRELELLSAVAGASNQASALDDALQVAVDGICNHLGWKVGHAFVVRPDGQLTSTRVWHLDDPAGLEEFRSASESMSFERGVGLPGRVLDTGQAAWIEDVSSSEEFVRRPLVEKAGLRGAFAFPILVGSQTVGVIEIFADVPATPDRGVLALVGQIGIQLGRMVERLRTRDEMTHSALHDGLTGLPNRVLLLDRLDLALVRAARRSVLTGLLFIDLDGFKAVNDTAGHHVGDSLLKEAARRLDDGLRKEDTVARLGGDEFVVLCEDLRHEREAVELAERLQRIMLRPFDIQEQEHLITASIGIAIARPGDSDAEALLQEADAAMYKAKGAGRARHELFSEAMRDHVIERMRVERALGKALEDGSLSLHYQPIVSLDGRRAEGVEAFVRWEDPERGIQRPADFLPIAEESTLILRIGEWVLREACRQAAEWRAQSGYEHMLPISVNLATRQLADEGLPATVRRALEEASLDPSDLRLEITESALLENADVPARALVELRRLGVGVLLDDFGTGYSSLSQLQQFPVDVLKIDSSFVGHLGDEPQAAAMVQAIVGMGHSLGLTIVAEGIETDTQAAEALRLGCDSGQGYWFARPAPTTGIDAATFSAN
jgi:diguanylate cyclase (GGDEF)-like protein